MSISNFAGIIDDLLHSPSIPALTESPPGVIIAHSPASSQQYIGSPSIAALPDGRYIASHDLFGPGGTNDQTFLYMSDDRGNRWHPCCRISGQWWSNLFYHHDYLYIMGTSREYGHVVIRRSSDGGKTWSAPDSPAAGLLLSDAKYHTAPVPVQIHDGRIWRAMEDAMGPGGWGEHFRSFMMSAPEDCDLLDASCWTCSNRIAHNPKWLDKKFGGWLEGNAVASPDGKLLNLLRVDYPDFEEKTAMIQISPDGREAVFDPSADFLDFPGGCKKFTIRYDPVSGRYWTITNPSPSAFRHLHPGNTRNTLALMSSCNLRQWDICSILMHHPDRERHGFQYIDWIVKDNDILYVSRTAWEDGLGGAHNQHDANFLTFHRIANFRDSGANASSSK
jgi:hypothetical protein